MTMTSQEFELMCKKVPILVNFCTANKLENLIKNIFK